MHHFTRRLAARIAGGGAAAALIAVMAAGRVSSQETHSYVPAAGFVPTAETALRVAEAILEPIYGAEQIRSQRPLTAQLRGTRWIVTGTLPPDRVGGVARIEIAKADGRVLRVSHGR